MNTLYCGIDNGLDGAVVLIDSDGTIIEKCVMPVIKIGKGRRVDVNALQLKFQSFSNLAGQQGKRFFVLLEEASKHSPGVLALCSTWFTYGSILAVLTTERISHEIVRPQAWQKEFWVRPKMPKGQKFDTKAAALLAAGRIWPGHDWTKSERATKAHDGLVDAALIAEHGRRKSL